MESIIVIFILFLVVLLILYLFFNKEHFNSCYTDTDDNQIYGNEDMFYDNDKININNLNCDRLCIQETNGEIECISKEELFTILNLPNFRKYNICVNGACMTNREIKILNGKEPIVFKAYPQNQDKCMKMYEEKNTHVCDDKTNISSRQHVNIGECTVADPLENSLKMYLHEGIPKYNITKNRDLQFDNSKTKNIGFSLAKHGNHNENNPN